MAILLLKQSMFLDPRLGKNFRGGEPGSRNCRESLQEMRCQVRDFHPFLFPGIAVSNGNSFVFERLMIDGDAEGRADFILARVKLADAARIIVNSTHDWLQRALDGFG